MSEDKKINAGLDGENTTPDQNQVNEDITIDTEGLTGKYQIDDFAKALLDQKRDLNLFSDDVTSEDIDEMMTTQQRRNAEATMSHALDALRKERGQSTIEEEEDTFAWNQLSEPVFVEEVDEDITTDSVVNRNKGKASSGIQTPVYETPGKTAQPEKSIRHNKADYIERTESRPKRRVKKKSVAILVLIGIVIAALFGGYAWKVLVYDKEYSMDASQQAAYDRLIKYADEFGMSSDAEKSEIISMESDYNLLSEKKKVEIDAYFKEHTGSDFPQLLQTYKDQKNQADQEAQYNAMLAQAQNYTTLDEAGQQDFLSKRSLYDSLNDDQKNAINAALTAQGQPDYPTLTPVASPTEDANQSAEDTQQPETPEVPVPEQPVEVAPAADNSAQIAEYQNAINSLSADRQAYLEFITAEGQDPSTDEILAQYDRDIAYYQGLIDSLQ